MWRESCAQNPGVRKKRERGRNGRIKSVRGNFGFLLELLIRTFFFAALGFKKYYFPVNLHVKSVIYRQR